MVTENSISKGIISNTHPNKYLTLQTDVAISHGSSGGGLFDREGNLIGITTSKRRNAEGLTFAISTEPILDILHEENKNKNTTKKQVSQTISFYKSEAPGEWRTITIQAKDTLAKIFARHGFSKKDLHDIMTLKNSAKIKLVFLQPGQTLKVKVENKEIHALSLNFGPGSTLNIVRGINGFQVEHKQLPIEKQLAFGKCKIHNSLFGSAKTAGLDSKVVAQLIEIFGRDIDFSLDLRPNDTFRVLLEKKYIDDEHVETGNILAAEIVNRGTKYQAVRYTDRSGSTGYFSPNGFGLHTVRLPNKPHIGSVKPIV